MSGYDPLVTNTPEREIAEHALAVLAAYLGDYTDPDEDGHCARIVVLPGGGVEQGYFDVEVHRAGARPSPRLRVSVVVAPAPYPVTMKIIGDEASLRGARPVQARDGSGVVRVVSGAGHGA